MTRWRVLLATLVVAGAPIGATLLVALAGRLRVGPALVILGASLLGAVWLALLHASDLERLAPDAARRPRLPPLAALRGQFDRAARARAAESLEAEHRWRWEATLIEHLPDPLVVLGPKAEVRRANAAARASFGTDLPAVLRHPLLRGAVDRALAEPRDAVPVIADLLLPAPVQREVQATVMRLDAAHEGGLGVAAAHAGGVVVVLSDRSRERAIERMRADFVANVSHELRTPLTSLIGFVETLRGPAADDKPAQRRFLGIMAEQADRMKQLIDDLLSLSRIELTEHMPPSGQVDVASLLARLIAGFELRLSERRMRCETIVEPGTGSVLGDEGQLAQVLQNLLDNGVKYGSEGGVLRVGLSRAPRGASVELRDGVLLTVADDGQGIPKHHLPRLTERFYRVDKARSRAVGGTGLGLAIVKHIVNRHRGQLSIDSVEGRGTTVTVWLPR